MGELEVTNEYSENLFGEWFPVCPGCGEPILGRGRQYGIGTKYSDGTRRFTYYHDVVCLNGSLDVKGPTP